MSLALAVIALPIACASDPAGNVSRSATHGAGGFGSAGTGGDGATGGATLGAGGASGAATGTGGDHTGGAGGSSDSSGASGGAATTGAGGAAGGGGTGGSGDAGGASGAAGRATGGGGMAGGAGNGMGGAGGSKDGTPPLGSGWVEYFPTKTIHLNDDVDLQTFPWTAQKSVCTPVCADYRYDAANDTETFRIIDNRSNRAEIRLQNEYSIGSRQFQGFVKFDAPLNDESLFQIFGSTDGATQLMVRGYAASGGTIRSPGGPDLVTKAYGVEHRVNVIHRQGNDVRVYIDGAMRYSFADTEAVTNYQKYGCYGTLKTGAVTVTWRAARFFQNGQPP